MGNRAAADSKFGSDILLLPALEVKLDDLHMYRLKGLQWNVIGRGHGSVYLSITLLNYLKLYYFCLFYMAGSAGSVKYEYFLLMLHCSKKLS